MSRVPVTGDSRPGFLVLPLFTSTLFISAALLFSVQPMFARMVLPVLGGRPAVWNTCMVFFQAFHISNNHELEPTVANLAHDRRLIALAQLDLSVTSDEARAGKVPSHWAVPARRQADLGTLMSDRRWHVLSPRQDKTLWTDNFSNILEIIKWR